MRDIIFRGKRTDNGEWMTGDLRHLRNGDVGIHDEILGMIIRVDPETVGQYTGLTDKNGKKIFEGDIIESSGNNRKAVLVVCYGEFEPKMFYDLIEIYVSRSGVRPTEKICGVYAKSLEGEKMFMTNASSVIKIIGNIHDNPELLKVGEEK